MTEIDPVTGLPKDLVSFEDIAKESQTINVYTEKRKFGKKYTVVEGINSRDIDVKDLAKKLKLKFSCGGTAKDGKIELQGDHTRGLKDQLIKLDFPAETIQVRK